MSDGEYTRVFKSMNDEQVASQHRGPPSFETTPKLHCCYELYKVFKRFRENNQCRELILYLTKNYPNNVKNKTFNFINTGHLFHSLYAYIPALTGAERERKQIRLSVECIRKLFESTINPFKLYGELFQVIQSSSSLDTCPCELLISRRESIKDYVRMIKEKKFDTKPPKLKKDNIDNIMYKYSINWKNILLKKKIGNDGRSIDVGDGGGTDLVASSSSSSSISNSVKKKRKIKHRKIMTDEFIKFDHKNDNGRLFPVAGWTLRAPCNNHEYIVAEKQLRAGDEAVSFIRRCVKCGTISSRSC
ncbi:late expression factor 5 [Spodoptera litura nucleopolyhedrovirus]|uniref:Late expression factor 5 n=1 Tax=Spodoptera litura multicapsid nucleopolyhedrovirus TaxID=46242 RepID=Q91BD8_NPVST|nr:LEF-5 [Spodoptera litura nucleopolyhedrovirus]AAL01771.1 late expression factor 5 [Spodoptera litura nucleopolyhedrovirus]QHN73938.1 lef-5 [Spodoptera litura nucleopolyhedrovirus]UQV25623.1 LEF-5 [Spodoptera litura nucleopolyhedrovirus]WOC30948.1 Late expression factor 5 [Spodoptera litura nucleopolyhedrovirus]